VPHRVFALAVDAPRANHAIVVRFDASLRDDPRRELVLHPRGLLARDETELVKVHESCLIRIEFGFGFRMEMMRGQDYGASVTPPHGT